MIPRIKDEMARELGERIKFAQDRELEHAALSITIWTHELADLLADRAAMTAEIAAKDAEIAALLSGEGYVFDNPDTGEEYAKDHPRNSGECDDATDIRKSTKQEDLLHREFQVQYLRADAAEAALAKAREDCAKIADEHKTRYAAELKTTPILEIEPHRLGRLSGHITASGDIAKKIRSLP